MSYEIYCTSDYEKENHNGVCHLKSFSLPLLLKYANISYYDVDKWTCVIMFSNNNFRLERLRFIRISAFEAPLKTIQHMSFSFFRFFDIRHYCPPVTMYACVKIFNTCVRGHLCMYTFVRLYVFFISSAKGTRAAVVGHISLAAKVLVFTNIS